MSPDSLSVNYASYTPSLGVILNECSRCSKPLAPFDAARIHPSVIPKEMKIKNIAKKLLIPDPDGSIIEYPLRKKKRLFLHKECFKTVYSEDCTEIFFRPFQKGI